MNIILTRYRSMKYSMWSNKNGWKYYISKLLKHTQYTDANGWSLLLLNSNKIHPNILDLRTQLKSLTNTQKQKIYEICKNRSKNEGSETNENLMRSVSEWDSEASSARKYRRLKDSLKLEILNLHFMKNLSRTQISNQLVIPYSTVSRVIREFNTLPGSTKTWFEYKSKKIPKSSSIAKAIKNYVKNTKVAFSSASIEKFIKQELNISIWSQSIAKFMKRELWMSYRKASSRPTNASSSLNRTLKSLFWIELSNIVDISHVYVNIDEVLFSNSTKVNYTWCEKGKCNIVYNSSFTGSLALICAITSYGDWFCSSLDSRNNSDTFITFVCELVKWLTLDLEIDSRRIILIMDNSPIHTSKATMSFLKEQKCKTIFIAPYCPQFAPIELMFHILKRRLCEHSKGAIINLKKEDGIKAIREVLATFSAKEIVSFWRWSFSNVEFEVARIIENLTLK